MKSTTVRGLPPGRDLVPDGGQRLRGHRLRQWRAGPRRAGSDPAGAAGDSRRETRAA